MLFKEKTVIITGASSGIGRAVASILAQRGAFLVLAARNMDNLVDTVRECTERGGQAIAVACDVTKPEDCKHLVDEAVRVFGGVDALVNNAGISMWGMFEEIDDLAIFDDIMKVNYYGAVYCTHYALPHLKKSKGLLTAVSSLTGKTGVPTRTAYSASKHAMQGFFDSLRVELTPYDIDVLVVSPGFVSSGMHNRLFGPDGEKLPVNPRDESKDTMQVDVCASQIVYAMESRKRELVMTLRGKLGQFLKLFFPKVIDKIAAKAVGLDPDRKSNPATASLEEHSAYNA